jgi:DNA-binding NarL/FixJ family response regulator
MQDSKSAKDIRILVADDHPLVRSALRALLENEADIKVIAEAGDGEKAVELATQLMPGVVIMDISMPLLSGLEATRLIRAKCPNTAILVLTVHSDDEHIFGIMEAGATGYLTKSVFEAQIPRTVRAVANGETVLSPEVFKQLLKHTLRYPTRVAPKHEFVKLSPRELEVLKLVSTGMSNKDMANRLSLSIPTIKNYLADIFSKLGAGSRTEAVIIATRLNLVNLNDE